MNRKRIQNIIIVVGVIVAAFFVYTIFTGDTTQGEVLVGSVAGDVRRPPVVEELIAILNKLSELEIAPVIFDDASYRTLEDYTVTVSSQPQGRANPFEDF